MTRPGEMRLESSLQKLNSGMTRIKLGPAPFSLAVWAGVKGNIGRAAACYCYCYCILGETGCLSAVWKIGSSSVAVLSLTCGLLVQMFGELAGLGGCDSCKY